MPADVINAMKKLNKDELSVNELEGAKKLWTDALNARRRSNRKTAKRKSKKTRKIDSGIDPSNIVKGSRRRLPPGSYREFIESLDSLEEEEEQPESHSEVMSFKKVKRKPEVLPPVKKIENPTDRGLKNRRKAYTLKQRTNRENLVKKRRNMTGAGKRKKKSKSKRKSTKKK